MKRSLLGYAMSTGQVTTISEYLSTSNYSVMMVVFLDCHEDEGSNILQNVSN
jgi:hypothetical protein